jgi:hypothetical protein
MKRLRNAMTAILALLVAGALAQGATKPAPPSIPAGTTLTVSLGTTLTDKTNKTGDKFTGLVKDPIYSDGKPVIPQWSTVNGHIAFLKPSGRVAGKAQMRLVLDSIVTPNGVVYPLNGTLEQAQGGVCAHTATVGKTTKADEEGTITGCGKSKKGALEAMGIAGGVGAGVGASVAMGKEMECEFYGYCPGGAGIGTDLAYGAGIGAGTALIYTLFKHEKHIVLVEGDTLTFTVDRTTMGDKTAPTTATPASD